MDKTYPDITYRQTKPIGRQNLSADKTYRQTKPIVKLNLSSGQKLSEEKTHQQDKTYSIGGQNHVQEDMYIQGGADSIWDTLGKATRGGDQ